MRLFNAPNLMSCSRLVLAAAFPFAAPPWDLALVVLAALTDALDGMLARWLRLQSVAGQILDPIGDKVFALTVLMTLCFEERVAWWQLLPVLSRDLVAAAAGVTLALRRRWAASALLIAAPMGKIATVFEYLWFAAILTAIGEMHRLPLFWLTALTCVAAAVQYATRLIAALRDDSSHTEATGGSVRRKRKPD